jgi:DNA-binding XRE family transcriptional regulator
MPPIRPQTIRTSSGEELVVLTRAEFDALAAAAAEHIEDADDVAVYDARKAALQAEDNPILPAEVSAAMLAGDSLLRALRRWKGITQAELAERTGLAQGYISDLETGRKTGTADTLRAIAGALEVDSVWLAP